jgi:hypothetical protein
MMRAHAIAAAVLAIVALSGVMAHAQPARAWDRLQMLVGTWESSGDTQLGQGEGSASFSRELNGQVIVRRSFADYKSGPQAGTRHDDLLIIYRDAPEGPPKAIYFDSEGHVIRYAVDATDDNTIVFESDRGEPGPRYRLSYTRSGASLAGTFEIAPPGGEYKTYLSWRSTGR